MEPISVETSAMRSKKVESVFQREALAGSSGWKLEGTNVMPQETSESRRRVAARR
jgi:hypothetical protein